MTQLTISAMECTRVHVSGDLDLCTASELRSELSRLVDAGARHLILDMRKVDFMDASGLVVLIQIRKRVSALGGSLALINPNHAVQKVLAITRLTNLFETHETPNGQGARTVPYREE